MNYTDPKTGVRVSTHITQPVEYEAWINGKKVEPSSDSMTNEKVWKDNLQQTDDGEFIVSSDDFDKIVASATRRGEVKAWEEARVIVEQQRLLACYPGIPQLKSGGIAYMRTLEEIDAKLTSLKTP